MFGLRINVITYFHIIESFIKTPGGKIDNVTILKGKKNENALQETDEKKLASY